MNGETGDSVPLEPTWLAGFEVFGERQDDGSIILGHTEPKKTASEFPAAITVLGVTYTLEFVKENEFPSTINIPADDPRRRICWGVYV